MINATHGERRRGTKLSGAEAPLRVVLIEEEEAARQIVSALGESGYASVFTRVETASEMSAALDAREWDLVIADYFLPQFSALAALALLQDRKIDLPLIVVSGAIGEEAAVAAIKAGAHDLVRKERLAGLGPSVARELRNAAERRRLRGVEADRSEAEIALQCQRERLEEIANERTGELMAKNAELATEIAERRQTEERLRLIAQRFKIALKNSPIVVFNQDLNLRYTWLYNSVLGWSGQTVVGKTTGELFERPEDAAAMDAIKREVIETGRGQRQKIVIGWRGALRYFDFTAEPLRNRYGTIVGVTCAAVDITESRAVEQAMRESEMRYRSLFENNLDAIFSVDAQGRFLSSNPAAEALSGYSGEELRTLTFASMCAPEYLMKSIAAFEASFRERQNGLETAFYRKDGRRVELFVTGVQAVEQGKVVALFCIARDITQQKRIEQQQLLTLDQLEAKVHERTRALQAANGALSASYERFRQMAENVNEVFCLTHPGFSRVCYVSPAFEKIWRRPCRELYAAPAIWVDAIHPQDREGVRQALMGEDSGASTEREYRIVRPDGAIRWVLERAFPVRDEAGQVHRVARVVHDITQRKTAEKALERAHRALLVLKDCDEALARIHEEQALLETVCQIVLRIEGVKMAWVGFAEPDAKKYVRPAAQAGDCDGYLRTERISWADEPQGRGPTGSAIRIRQFVRCGNVRSDECVAPWREEQLKRGFEASIALPLIWEGRALGALTIYSVFADAFNEEEIELLKQLAGDLTFGIVALRTRAEREQLQKELLKISEREKQLISQELHDGLCQHLAGTALMGTLLQRRLAAQQNPETEYAKQICDLLNTGVAEARNLSHGLHPVKPEGEGLMEALAGLAQTITRLFHLKCSFRCDDSVSISSQATATHLFRIAQEAINNAHKHGQASKVEIALSNKSGAVVLSIRDNGVGVPKDLPVTGMGMQIMKYRATEIGAVLTVCRAGKKGTVVSCVVPG